MASNIFLSDFYSRLRAWHSLKEKLQNTDTKNICIEVDKFWQAAPISAHYLHPDDINTWPNPWELLNDNLYCLYGRALGMIYTLLLLGIDKIDFFEAIDDNSEYVIVVSVDNAKYVLNGCPESVLNTDLAQYKITRRINITPLTLKIGK